MMEWHGGVIAFMQMWDTDVLPSEHSRTMRARLDELKADPKLRAAVLDHGRILDLSLTEGAPPERN